MDDEKEIIESEEIEEPIEDLELEVEEPDIEEPLSGGEEVVVEEPIVINRPDMGTSPSRFAGINRPDIDTGIPRRIVINNNDSMRDLFEPPNPEDADVNVDDLLMPPNEQAFDIDDLVDVDKEDIMGTTPKPRGKYRIGPKGKRVIRRQPLPPPDMGGMRR